MCRELTLADAMAMAGLDDALPEGELRRTKAEFESFLRQPAACGYGLEEQGQMVAYVLFTCAADTADLCHIVTVVEKRGQGCGKKLLAAALKALKARGVEEVFLEVRAGNEPAERLYAQFGAVEVGLRPGYYALPEGGWADARVLRLPLTA